MSWKTGRRVLSVVLAFAVSAGVAVVTLNRAATVAEAEAQSELYALLDSADAQLGAGDVWGAAVTLLENVRSLPPDAESIDDVLARMQFLSFVLCALMPVEDLPVFVQQLDPQYAGDALALMAFHRDYGAWWEAERETPFIGEEAYAAFLDQLSGSEVPLVRMSALLHQLLKVRDKAKEDPDAAVQASIGLVNWMADECPHARVTREAFREVVRQQMRRVDKIGPQGVRDFLSDPSWSAPMQQMIPEDGVVQALMEILELPAVSTAESLDEAAGRILAAALDASSSNPDVEVRAWFKTWLSSYLPDGKGTSLFGEIVRAAFNKEVGFLIAAGPQADRMPPDLAVAQRAVFLSALRQLETAKWDTGPSVMGPELAHYESLLAQKRQLEPIGSNCFERLPVEVAFYGYMSLNQNQYHTTAEVLNLLIEYYPNSKVALRYQTTLDHIAPLLNPQ